MSSLFGPGVMILFFIFVAALIFLYVMSILWAKKDAKARGANEKSAMLISLIPFAGVLAYVLMRPPLLKIDEEEQNLDIKLKTRQLKKYDVCPSCGAEIEDSYVYCPKCNKKLKEICTNCNKPLDLSWNSCPYCGTLANKSASDSYYTKQENIEAPYNEEAKKDEQPQVDYKVEDSFSFDENAVEDITPDNIAQPKHHFKNHNNKTHN